MQKTDLLQFGIFTRRADYVKNLQIEQANQYLYVGKKIIFFWVFALLGQYVEKYHDMKEWKR